MPLPATVTAGVPKNPPVALPLLLPLICTAAKVGTETLSAAAKAESLKAVLSFIYISISYKKTGLPWDGVNQ